MKKPRASEMLRSAPPYTDRAREEPCRGGDVPGPLLPFSVLCMPKHHIIESVSRACRGPWENNDFLDRVRVMPSEEPFLLGSSSTIREAAKNACSGQLRKRGFETLSKYPYCPWVRARAPEVDIHWNFPQWL